MSAKRPGSYRTRADGDLGVHVASVTARIGIASRERCAASLAAATGIKAAHPKDWRCRFAMRAQGAQP